MNKIKQLTSSIPFMILSALVTTIASIDIYVPCMPEMANFFQTSAYKLQLSVALGILGGSLVTPFIGPLSDSFGRRKLFVLGHALFSLCLLISGFARSIDQFILLRFCTGIFTAFTNILIFAIIADKYTGSKAVLYYGYTSTTITLTLVCAPLIGGYVADHFTWYVCFFIIGTLSGTVSLLLFLKFPETLLKKQLFSLKQIITTYKDILRSHSFMAMALIPSVMIAGMMSFISCAAFYYIKELSVSATMYSFYQAFIMICNATFSIIAGKSINRLGLDGTIKVGMTMFIAGGVGFLLAAILTPQAALNLTLTIALFSSGIGFVFAAITAKAMGVFPENAGATASMITFLRGFMITGFVYIAGMVYNGSILRVACLIVTVNVIVMGIYYVMRR